MTADLRVDFDVRRLKKIFIVILVLHMGSFQPSEQRLLNSSEGAHECLHCTRGKGGEEKTGES